MVGDHGTTFKGILKDGQWSGICEIKYVSGKLVKGHYQSNKRHGTFSWYLPSTDTNLAYWCKVDYDRGEKISD